jgi:ankyrin repeat protein
MTKIENRFSSFLSISHTFSFLLFKAGFTPVYIAAENGHTEALRVLICAGGDPNKAKVVSAPRVP